MAQSNKYGHISRQKKNGGAWRWAVIAAVCLWGLAVCVWNSGRIAALFDYHAVLGQPAVVLAGQPLYWPWKLLEWGSEYQHYEEVTRIVDQTYLMGVGVPLVLFIIYMASQQGLKGREDLHGSARWAEFKDIEGMGYSGTILLSW